MERPGQGGSGPPLETLNDKQREAVLHHQGPLLIIAGAGSGKTRTITHKIGHLISHQGVQPHNILAVTFTNKAAQEMRERVATLTEEGVAAPLISTFHSLSTRLLRRHAPVVGYGHDFAICDSPDQQRVYRSVYQELDLSADDLPIRMVQSVISRAKNLGRSPENLAAGTFGTSNQAAIAEIYKTYQRHLKRANAMDFDDLILNGVELLKDPQIRERYGTRFRYLLVDEYQDTNAPQHDLLTSLTQSHNNVTAVGDEDQSIYAFRGADVSNILRFEQDFPGARIIHLEQNYRSSQLILDAASAVISNNTRRREKTLWTESAEGKPISLFVAGDARTEALYVSYKIYSYLRDQGKEVGVLYRTNFQSRHFEEEFRRLNIPYKLVGGESFYNRKEVKDALAYLRVVTNPHDTVALLRIINEPPRRIGKTTVERLEKRAREHQLSVWDAIKQGLDSGQLPGPAHRALRAFLDLVRDSREALQQPLHLSLSTILDKVGYRGHLKALDNDEARGRLLNLDELVTVARDAHQRGDDIRAFLDDAALYSETDTFDASAPVTLMTLHNAKGLEFEVVFMVGCEEGLFPHSRSTTEEELEEERRLCYVGITRARKKLYFSYSRSRRQYGQESHGFNLPSRFLSEVPQKCLLMESSSGFGRPPSPSMGTSTPRAGRQASTFSGATYNSKTEVQGFLDQIGKAKKPSARALASGALVQHREFGRGKVLQVEDLGDDLKVTVRFPGIGIKKMFQRFAHLKVV